MGIERNPSLGLTINPYTGNIEPISITNTFRISTDETFSSVIAIPTGLDFYVPDLTISSIFDIINEIDGTIIETLEIDVLTELGGGIIPLPTQIQYYDTDNTPSILYVNSIHSGKLLRITVSAINNVLTSEERKIQRLPVGSLIAVNNQTFVMNENAYKPCGLNGQVISVNRFEFPEYYNWNVDNGFPYGQTAGNPHTPFLKEHVLRGVGNDVSYLKDVGKIENRIQFPTVSWNSLLYRNNTDIGNILRGNTSAPPPTSLNYTIDTDGTENIIASPNFNTPVFQGNTLQSKIVFNNNDLSMQYLAVQYYIKVD